jgi:prephenate dehydratase
MLAREPQWAQQSSDHLITTFVFNVRNVPAALYKALGGFATNGVNMTKLESYMVDGSFTATQFYADVDGHPDDKGLAFALEELRFFSKEFRIIGVYPGAPVSRDVRGGVRPENI